MERSALEAAGAGRLTCGSCLDPEMGLPALPDKSVDHVITDPPYEDYLHAIGLAAKYAYREDGRRRKEKEPEKEDIEFSAMDEKSREEIARQMVRISRGWVLVFCQIEAVGRWQEVLLQAGAARRNTVVWYKPDAAPSFFGEQPSQGCEAMVCMWAGTGRSIWAAGGKVGYYPYVTKEPSVERRHPTQKPLRLMSQVILDFTQRGQVICDPYMGGGQTGVAAKQLGRPFVGWELEETMFGRAKEAIDKTREQTLIELAVHSQLPKVKKESVKAKKARQGDLF